MLVQIVYSSSVKFLRVTPINRPQISSAHDPLGRKFHPVESLGLRRLYEIIVGILSPSSGGHLSTVNRFDFKQVLPFTDLLKPHKEVQPTFAKWEGWHILTPTDFNIGKRGGNQKYRSFVTLFPCCFSDMLSVCVSTLKRSRDFPPIPWKGYEWIEHLFIEIRSLEQCLYKDSKRYSVQKTVISGFMCPSTFTVVPDLSFLYCYHKVLYGRLIFGKGYS